MKYSHADNKLQFIYGPKRVFVDNYCILKSSEILLFTIYIFLFKDDHLKMTTSRNVADGGYNCRVRLDQILAIIVRKEGCRGDPGDFWMYENGYLLFQVNFKNYYCFSSLNFLF